MQTTMNTVRNTEATFNDLFYQAEDNDACQEGRDRYFEVAGQIARRATPD